MSEKPLHNVIICCTSVTQEERSSIVRKALEMGATVQADLTSDVTHLIAARLQTEKFKFAARHRTDVKLMTVDWVPAIHAIWITGRDVNLPWSEDKYRLPIFHGYKICVTNLEVELRTQVEQLVTQHGAQYSGDLTKENTHLIAGAAGGKKHEAVLAWQCDIMVVGIEWVYESIKRGAALDENFFGLDLSPEVRGQTSWYPPKVVPKPDIFEDSFSPRESKKRKRSAVSSASRKRLSKHASDYSADGFWTELLKNEDTETENNIELQAEQARDDRGDGTATNFNLLPEELTRGIFEGRSFFIAGFAQREEAIVQRTLQSNGGMLVALASLADMIVVPQNGDPPEHDHYQATLVTEYWLERCLSLHRFEEPTDHFTSTPFRCALPIARMEQLSICTSGFSAVESMHIEKLVKRVGAIACETLTKGRSILLAATRDCRKYQLAKDNGTRVVKVEWLWECIRRGKMIGVTEYALDGIIGSQCRIDGNVALRQRRSKILDGVVCCIHGPTPDLEPLRKMAKEMGARVASSIKDSHLTHLVVDAGVAPQMDRPNVFQVSSLWLKETFALISRQLESSYPIRTDINDENTPPTDAAPHVKTNSAQKLAGEMSAIRRRITTNNARRSDRKILGRASTLSHLDNVSSMMMATNEDESLDNSIAGQRASSQGVTYSDPEVVEKQRELMMKLGALESDTPASSLRDDDPSAPRPTGSRGSMRAVGLDDTRKLRR